MHQLLGMTNEAGVYYSTGRGSGVGLEGWLTLLAVIVTVATLCWLGNWAVRRRFSGEEAASSTREPVDRLIDGILQTYRQ